MQQFVAVVYVDLNLVKCKEKLVQSTKAIVVNNADSLSEGGKMTAVG
jgi:hypothetical protein